MKYLLVLSFFVLFVIAGCGGGNKKPDEQKLDSKAVKDISLEYRFKLGETFQYKFTTETADSQKLTTNEVISQNVSELISYLIDVEVKEVDKAGIAELNLSFSSVDYFGIVPPDTIRFKSGEKLDIRIDTTYKKLLMTPQTLDGASFRARIDKKGNVVEVYRIDEVSKRYLELLKIDQQPTADEFNQLKQNIDFSLLRPILVQLFRTLPENKLAVDSTWVLNQPPSDMGIFTLKNTHHFKVSSFEKAGNDTIVVIDASLTDESAPNPKAKENNITVDNLKFTGDGQLRFNISQGRYLATTTKTHSTIKVTQSAQTPKGIAKAIQESANNRIHTIEYIKK